MRNITKDVKEAIAVNALWSVSDFYYLIEKLGNNGFEISHWKGEEYWAGVIFGNILIGYIWQKYPLVIVKEDHAAEMMVFIEELKYIIVIKSKDLISPEFTIDMDEELVNRITIEGLNTKSFSASDFWFHTVN